MYGAHPSPRERLRDLLLTGVVTALVGWALIAGLAMGRGGTAGESLSTFDVVPPPPEPVARVVPERRRSRRPEGRAAPAGLRAQATEVVAPPVPPIVPPPPVVAAPVAGVGAAATQGAAERPGPGPGAGGIGDGRGSGGDGDGDGGGFETEPRWLKGRLRWRDGGDQFGEAVNGRAVSLRCTLQVNTRLTGCVAARPSGLPGLDALVARLVEERFRYSPWLDEDGRPVRSTILIDQHWDEER